MPQLVIKKIGEKMEKKKKNYSIVFAIIISIAALLQIYGTIRYIKRMPQDTVGIVIYSIVCALFVILALGNYIKWLKTKNSDKKVK